MKQIIEVLEKSSEFFGDPKEGDNEHLWTLCNEATERAKEMRQKVEALEGLSQDAIDYSTSLEKRIAGLHNQQPLGYCQKVSVDKYKASVVPTVLVVGSIRDGDYCIPVYERAGL